MNKLGIKRESHFTLMPTKEKNTVLHTSGRDTSTSTRGSAVPQTTKKPNPKYIPPASVKKPDGR